MPLGVASSQGRASQDRYNSDPACSSLSNAHSDFVAHAAAPARLPENAPHLQDARQVQIEVASRSGFVPRVCARPQPEFLPASFSQPSILQSSLRIIHDRQGEWKETPRVQRSRAPSLSFLDRRLFESIRRRRLLSDRRRIDTSRSQPQYHPSARLVRPGVVQDRYSWVPPVGAHMFPQFVYRVIRQSIASGFVARLKPPSLCL